VTVKLADFGIHQAFDGTKFTTVYQAPEIFSSKGQKDPFAADGNF
jgi:hypothetical protein